MQRRLILMAAAGWGAAPSWAHHGWSNFDAERPIYLEGKATKVAWRNPHAELDLALASPLQLPADLARRPVPPQSAAVDAPGILAKTQLPTRRDKVWHVELAPLSRMQAWQVAEIKPGASLALVGYTFPGEKGEPIVRVEYLFVDGKAYALRSSPA
jgi:hypothetical protein